MTEHRIGTQEEEEWRVERDELLKEEKELTRRGDELARKRRELPWVPVEKDYRFETEDGTTTLAELFDGKSQLLVYHFMFGPSFDDKPVRQADLRERSLSSPRSRPRKTPLPRSTTSSTGGLSSQSYRDLGFQYTEEELKPFLEGEIPLTVEQNARMCGTDVVGYVSEGPGLSAYALSDGIVYRTYVTTARGLEPAMAYYALLDRTPKGRDESDTRPLWVRRHDEYETS